ncbi:MetQ/NlpA family ABC transporter substrate-binding protein [Kineosporia rhizophila]|uniref:MetQ/NlpA family ABC transporter substrate-binding protein n=1 Tax=Kineosporia rhizophila TaxID=84633 RepID=UPI001E45DA60|nr:MetQ/NlpA family ABC transporter substrate-binding protein [Kineosporia rhizophila]MCE0535247.1 MetQ/NlpA family ABC transporter substrate-binding protein [Kineosporia rhizophila]
MSAPTPPSDSSDANSAPQLPAKQGNTRRNAIIAGAAAAVVAIAGITYAVTSGGDDEEASASAGGAAPQTVKIGVADAAQPYWKTYTDLVKKELNVTVELVNFGDYSQPNPALKQGEVDLNQFQHIQYLADYNVSSNDTIQPIGATAVYPLPLYSSEYKSVEEIPKDAEIAIPNDTINEARGLLVLQAAGLLTLKDGGGAFSSVEDIESTKVKVTPLDASQTAGAVKSGSVAGAIVNKNFATDAGLKTEEALFQDDPASEAAAPYVNIFAARAEDKDNETYLKLAELYHDPAVEAGVQESNGGTAVFRTTPAAELQEVLKTVEEQARAAK